MYELYKYIDGEYYIYGTYSDVMTLSVAAHQLGIEGYEQIKVVQE